MEVVRHKMLELNVEILAIEEVTEPQREIKQSTRFVTFEQVHRGA